MPGLDIEFQEFCLAGIYERPFGAHQQRSLTKGASIITSTTVFAGFLDIIIV